MKKKTARRWLNRNRWKIAALKAEYRSINRNPAGLALIRRAQFCEILLRK